MNCVVCETRFRGQWTDTHGVGACLRCGTAYRIYHYENGVRLDKEPALLTKPEWIPVIKRYHAETLRKAPNGFDIPGSYYSGVNRADYIAWNEWCAKNKATLP